MTDATRNVLFLCTGNSARSVLAEALLNHFGGGRLKAYSAGSRPAGKVNPFALELLAAEGLSTAGLRSKNWSEFAEPDAPRIDIVFTVCDSAAKETCPIWPGAPVSVHWGIADPAAVEGSDAARRAAFRDAYDILRRRIASLVALPVANLDRTALRKALADIASE